MTRKGDRPNILLIEADQMASFVLSFYDPRGQARTPNLDALARDGVLFRNAYCNSPLCCPSRAAMFTGSKPSHNEVWGNGSEFNADIPTMMHFLKSAGYRTVVSGKTHFVGPDQLHGFDRRLTTDMYPSGFGWSIDWKPRVKHQLGTSTKRLELSGLCRTNDQILFDTEVQFRAIEFLRYEALEQHDSPFFLHVSYTQPHDPFQSVPKYWDLYEDMEIDLPRLPEDDDPHPVTKWLKVHHGVDRFPPSAERIRATRRGYYAMISHIDEFVGDIVAELKLLGLYDDTVIIFCSDHGEMLGERNMWFKRNPYEQSVRVPLIFHSPKRFAPREVTQTVSLADLCPTLAEIGGAKNESDRFGGGHGDSFVRLLNGQADGWKDEAVIEYFGAGVEEPWLCIRRGDDKYVYTRNHPPVLFNLAEDPDETVNLAGEASLQNLTQALHAALLDGIDIDKLTNHVIGLKQTRRFIHAALETNGGYSWDYQPHFDASKQYVRGLNKPATC